MKELAIFVVLAGVFIGLMKGVGAICHNLSRKWNISPTIPAAIAVIILFLISSYLWIFTEFYQKLSEVIGVPLKK